MNTTTITNYERLQIETRVFGDDLEGATGKERDQYLTGLQAAIEEAYPGARVSVQDCQNLGGYNGGPRVYSDDIDEDTQDIQEDVKEIEGRFFQSFTWADL